MSRWFRHYAGMMRDAKLVRVAVRVKQPVERVVWVWGAILESAAEIDDAGRYELDAPEVAYFLRTDEVDIRAIADGLADAGHVAADRVVKWGDRQYQSDTSKERQARYRERQRGQNPVSDGQRKESDVTPPSRDGKVTPQETDTDTDKGKEEPSGSSKKPTRLPAGFEFPSEWRQWAINAGLPSVRCELEFTKLTNWAANAPGAKGAKRDWFKAWQNWALKAIDELPKARGSPPRQPNLADGFAALSHLAENQYDPRSDPSDESPRRTIPDLSRVSG